MEFNFVFKYVKFDVFVFLFIGMYFGNNLNIFFFDKNFFLLDVDMLNCVIFKFKVVFSFWFGRKLIIVDWEFFLVFLVR